MRSHLLADPMTHRRRFTLAWLLAGLLLGILLAGCSAGKPEGPGHIQLSPPELDLGAIPNTGPVSCTLKVRNVGRGWLEITGLSTSCGCTTAEIARQRLAPGEATDLVVTFDPQAHGGLTGPFLRQVYIRSNDPETPEAVLTFRGTVVAAVGAHQNALPQPAVLSPHSLENAVTVYYNRACADCLEYVQETVLPLLRERGYPEPVYKDYINEPANRAELLARSDALGVPPGLQSHLTVFIGDRIILEGHVPDHVVADLLAAPPDAFDRIVVYQDRMSGATDYTVWAFRGEPQTYPLGTPLREYLVYLQAHGEHLPASPAGDRRALLPLVLTTGFLDGLNPCAFAVLLFFIAFLFTIRRTVSSIWAMGLIYIAAIYLAYFLIGLGLIQAVLFTGEHHLMARVGSWLVIALGLINVKDYFFPQLPIHLRIPTIAHGTIQDWLKRATYPAAAVGGFLVGLCTFPCSGGIYVAIVGLLTARTTYWQGVGYLGLYNLMFVLPLLLILAGVGNRRVLHRIRLVEQSSRRWVRLATGLGMIVVGAVILVWFV
jgi:cytochrome c biogenesis protein CcdA